MFPGQPHGRFSVLANGELRIRDVRREDEGVYVCSALSVAGSSIAKAELRIALADDRPPPIIRQGKHGVVVVVGVCSCYLCCRFVVVVQKCPNYKMRRALNR